MIGKKINQLATELAPTTTDLTIIGDPVTGVSKKITLEQLGAIFGGAVSFYTTLGDFPATGVIDIIYCAKDTQKLYLWSGSAYVEVFPSQALLNTYQLRSEKGVSNGYASLDVNGKVPIGQLPNSIMEYKGTWNAATNTPTLANGTGDTGDVYICNVAGTVNFGAGPITFAVGDYVVYSGTIWQRSSGAVGTVTSVGLSITGDSIGVTGSPITTSGTLALAFAGNSTQYINGAGNLVTFPGVINEAQNLITEVYNKTGATLTKGTVVYINGGQGNLPTITKALATGDATSAQTYGIVRNNITNNNNGYVVVAGRISDLDTQAYTEGTQLYLSPTTAGTFTSTKPYAPNHLVYVGIVVRAHPTQGVVEVKIQNGYEMDELHNVAAQSPDNNDILQYKTATSLWTKVAGTTTNIAEGTNLYYTDARSRAALSFTAGSGAYNSTTGVITIPTNTNQLTNGAAFITLASLSAGAGISYNNTTGVIASTITQYTDALARAAISLTTTGTSGAATYNSTTGVLNIPQYQTALTNPVTGTGTTNYLPKFTGTSTIGDSIVQDNGSTMTIGGSLTLSASSGFPTVGLLNRSSDTTLYMVSPASGFTLTDNSLNTIYNATPTSHNWNISNALKMKLDASGNLGLGVTPSAWGLLTALQVKNAFIAGANDNSYFGANTYYDGNSFTYRYINTNFANVYTQQSGQHQWLIAPSGTAGNAISFTQAMTLDASGRLGIGLTSPNAPLTVQSNSGGTGIHIVGRSGDGFGFLTFRNNANNTVNGEIGISDAQNMLFYTGASVKLTIASTGAATFSSSVTAGGVLDLNSNTTPTSVSDKFAMGVSGTSYAWIQSFGGRPLVLNSAGNNVGIGTTSPQRKLQVTSDGTNWGSAIFGGAGGTDVIQLGNLNGYATIAAVNSALTAYTTLQLGNNALTIASTGAATFSSSVTAGGSSLFSASNTLSSDILTVKGGGASGLFGFKIEAANGEDIFYTDNYNYNVIANPVAGKFGIGTTSPTEKLEVNGNIKTASPSSGSAHAWKLGSYAAGGTGTATGVIYIEVNGQIYSIPALLGTP